MRRVVIVSGVALAMSLVGGAIVFVQARHATHTEMPADQPALSNHQVTEVRDVTIPAGTTLTASLDNEVGSIISSTEDRVSAHVTRAIVVDGVEAVPEKSELIGAVTVAEPSHRVKGRARVVILFDRLWLGDGPETYDIRTPAITRTAEGTMKKDVLEVGVPAAAGAVFGGVFGGGKGALIGSAVAGGAGAGDVMSSKGPEVVIHRRAVLSVKLYEAVTVRVRVPLASLAGSQPSV